MELITRAAWGAREPKGFYSRLTSTRGVKVHYTGGYVDPAIVDDHRRCAALVRRIQNSHMDGNDWIDIGYSLICCPHRKVFIGRGPGHTPAANGAGLNSDHYAVLGLVGNRGLVEPPDEMLHGILGAIEWLRRQGGAGKEIKGHRDGYATECPGGPLYAWIKKGAPRPRAASWTEDLVRELPILREGADNYNVKTWRACAFARGRVTAAAYGGAAGLKAWLERTAFDPQLDAITRDIQRAAGLKVDGIVGQDTWAAGLRLT